MVYEEDEQLFSIHSPTDSGYKYGKGIERFDKVMKIVEEAKTEREVVEKLKELDKI